MLEVKNLKKIYKTKKGTDVHALDGVTLRFPETGMVFLLVFGPASLGVLILAALVTAVLATFLPVHNAAKKKPVDSIRAL